MIEHLICIFFFLLIHEQNYEIDANLSTECELLDSMDVDYVSARVKNLSEKFHFRVQYFATFEAAQSGIALSKQPQPHGHHSGGHHDTGKGIDLAQNLQVGVGAALFTRQLLSVE